PRPSAKALAQQSTPREPDQEASTLPAPTATQQPPVRANGSFHRSRELPGRRPATFPPHFDWNYYKERLFATFGMEGNGYDDDWDTWRYGIERGAIATLYGAFPNVKEDDIVAFLEYIQSKLTVETERGDDIEAYVR